MTALLNSECFTENSFPLKNFRTTYSHFTCQAFGREPKIEAKEFWLPGEDSNLQHFG